MESRIRWLLLVLGLELHVDFFLRRLLRLELDLRAVLGLELNVLGLLTVFVASSLLCASWVPWGSSRT